MVHSPEHGLKLQLLAIALIAALVFLHYLLWLDENGVRQTHTLRISIQAQTEDNAERAEKNHALAAEIEDLKRGLMAIEERARADMGMIRPDETFYRLLEKPQPATPIKSTPPPKPASPVDRLAPAVKPAPPAKPLAPAAAPAVKPASPAKPSTQAAKKPTPPAKSPASAPAVKLASPAKSSAQAAKPMPPAKPSAPAAKPTPPAKSSTPAAKSTPPVKPPTQPAKPTPTSGASQRRE